MRGHAGRFDAGEQIEGTTRLKARETHFPESVNQEIATEPVLFTHLDHVVVAMAQSFQRRFLADNRRTKDAVLMNPHHRVDQRCRRTGITDPKAGHRKGLGEAVKEDRPFPHAGQ